MSFPFLQICNVCNIAFILLLVVGFVRTCAILLSYGRYTWALQKVHWFCHDGSILNVNRRTMNRVGLLCQWHCCGVVLQGVQQLCGIGGW